MRGVFTSPYSARTAIARVAAAICVALLASGPARADAIDGDWCHAAQSLGIQGPAVRLPDGRSISGEYRRHSFSYVVPAGQPDSGRAVTMILIDDNTIALQRATAAAAAPEIWRRCEPIS